VSAVSSYNEVANALNRFMNCFDLKDWRQMADLLENRLQIDYSDLRGGSPSEVSADEYLRTRSDALQALSTHHQLTNLDISVSGDSASAAASCMIHRRRGEKFFNSHAFYRFRLRVSGGVWRISAISQHILWNEGDRTIHAGAKGGRA
jgi:SnoaL-like domain